MSSGECLHAETGPPTILGVTIRLFDTQAQKKHQEALEKYDAEVMEASEPGRAWPAGLQYPAPPEPMIDSRDAGALPVRNPPMMPGRLGNGYPARDADGTSAGCVDGFESSWSSSQSADTSPFKLKKE